MTKIYLVVQSTRHADDEYMAYNHKKQADGVAYALLCELAKATGNTMSEATIREDPFLGFLAADDYSVSVHEIELR